MQNIIIFSDAATSSQNKLSVGAFFITELAGLPALEALSTTALFSNISDSLTYRQYESNKSTWSEITTVIEALNMVLTLYGPGHHIDIYTDCQSLCDLLNRRKDKLQKNKYITSSGKIHPNAELYETLFGMSEQFQIRTFKVKGHDKSQNRIGIYQQIFDILDKLVRNHLRAFTA